MHIIRSITGLDSRTRGMLEEARGLLQTYKAIEASEREKLDTRLSAHVDQQNMLRDQRLVSMFKRFPRVLYFCLRHTRNRNATIMPRT